MAMTEEEDLREQLLGSLKNRALFYLSIYRELAREHGAESAARRSASAARRWAPASPPTRPPISKG